VIREEFEELNIKILNVSLGEVETAMALPNVTINKLKIVLEKNGFELIEDKRIKTIEDIKNFIINTIHKDEFSNHDKNFSELIEKKLGLEYHYLSTLFSSLESITIEQYIILQKIERAKELLKYGELTLSEIAYKLGYSSVQHLSNQFKKVTGFSASQFKSLTDNMRRPLDKVTSR